MLFKKKGHVVIEHIRREIEATSESLASSEKQFERDKDKQILHRIHELQVHMSRLKRLLPHIDPAEVYELTEQDLDDFGF